MKKYLLISVCITVMLTIGLCGCGNSPKSVNIVGDWYKVCEDPGSSWDNITFNSKTTFYNGGISGEYQRSGEKLSLQYPLVGPRTLTITKYDNNIIIFDDKKGCAWTNDLDYSRQLYEENKN